jgi:CRP-like cAMP-binding protein
MISNAKRTATVTAQTELHCLEIAFPDFRRFAQANPDVMWKLLQHVVSLLPGDPTG